MNRNEPKRTTMNEKENRYPVIDAYVNDEQVQRFLKDTRSNDVKGVILLLIISAIIAGLGFYMKDDEGPLWMIEGFALLWFFCGISVAFRIRHLFNKKGVRGAVCPIVDTYTTCEYDRDVRFKRRSNRPNSTPRRIVIEGYRCKLHIVYTYQNKNYTMCVRNTFIKIDRVTWDEEKYCCPELIGQNVYVLYPYNTVDQYTSPKIVFAHPDKAYMYEKAYDWYIPSNLRTKEM